MKFVVVAFWFQSYDMPFFILWHFMSLYNARYSSLFSVNYRGSIKLHLRFREILWSLVHCHVLYIWCPSRKYGCLVSCTAVSEGPIIRNPGYLLAHIWKTSVVLLVNGLNTSIDGSSEASNVKQLVNFVPGNHKLVFFYCLLTRLCWITLTLHHFNALHASPSSHQANPWCSPVKFKTKKAYPKVMPK